MNIYVLFLLAIIPIVWLMVSLVVLRLPAHKTCTATFVLTFLLAIIIWKMPILDAATASLEGVALAIWPITLVIVAAIFTYNLALHTKSMDTIKNMLSGISTDRRIQVLILAWGFGGFLEAVAGYGTAVAIPASILAALGFDPIFAAVICLIANTVPTAFGAIGTPVVSLAKVAHLDVNVLSYQVGLQLGFFIVILPLILVMMTTKSFKGLKGVFGITIASGLAFAIPEVLAAKFMGPALPALLGSVCSMAVTIILAKTFYKENKSIENKVVSFKQGVLAWLPYILVFAFVMISSNLFPAINHALAKIDSKVLIYTGKGAAPYDFQWIGTPGTMILIATIIGGLIQGAKIKDIIIVFGKTCKQLTKSTITVVAIVAMAKIMDYSGMIKSIAQVLVQATGRFYPIIAPMIGAIGTFVTGSDTSSNVLFGRLQTEVAATIHVNPIWLAAANTSGATAGKMISPQSIAIATAATGLAGSEGKILSKTLKFCIVYVLFLGIIVFLGSRFM
jgi:lactate permease